jgi:hypothetical protein
MRPDLRRTRRQVRSGRCRPPRHGQPGRHCSSAGWCAGPAGVAGRCGLRSHLRTGARRSCGPRPGTRGPAGRRRGSRRRVGCVRPQRLGRGSPRPGRKPSPASAPGGGSGSDQDAGGGPVRVLPHRHRHRCRSPTPSIRRALKPAVTVPHFLIVANLSHSRRAGRPGRGVVETTHRGHSWLGCRARLKAAVRRPSSSSPRRLRSDPRRARARLCITQIGGLREVM